MVCAPGGPGPRGLERRGHGTASDQKDLERSSKRFHGVEAPVLLPCSEVLAEDALAVRFLHSLAGPSGMDLPGPALRILEAFVLGPALHVQTLEVEG